MHCFMQCILSVKNKKAQYKLSSVNAIRFYSFFNPNNMDFEINRIINSPIKMAIPVNIIAKFIPKGLNQDSFGGVINIVPNKTDTIIEKMFVKRIKRTSVLVDNRPTKRTNKKELPNATTDAFGDG
jgi:hypothetical protein